MATTEVETEFFKRMMDINVTGSFLVTRSVGQAMKSQTPTPCTSVKPERAITRGTIVHMGSTASYLAGPGRCAYVVSKHAVLGLSRVAGKPTPHEQGIKRDETEIAYSHRPRPAWGPRQLPVPWLGGHTPHPGNQVQYEWIG